MIDPGRGFWRVLRGLILAGVCLVMSLTAHGSAGGTVHLSPGLLLGGLALSVICIAAADARRSFGGIAGVVLTSQVVLHLLAGAGNHLADPVGTELTTEMVAYHVLAAVAVSVLLAHGEQLMWALWDLARLPAMPVLRLPIPDDVSPVVTRAYDVIRPAVQELRLGGLTSRAPPAVG